MPDINASVVVIEELPEDGGLGRRLELVGAALPLQGASWPVEQRLVTTWFVGNAVEATQQVLGPIDPPSEWEFHWSRTLLARRPPRFVDEKDRATAIVHPHVLCRLFDDFTRRGFRLRVTWQSFLVERGGPPGDVAIVREGRIQNFAPKFVRLEDVDASAKFEWLGRGGTQKKAQDVRDGGIEAAAVAFQATLAKLQLEELLGTVARAQPSATPGTSLAGQLNKLANGPLNVLARAGRGLQQAATGMSEVVLAARKLVLTPQRLADAAYAIAQNAIAIANQTQLELSRTPPEVASLQTRASDVARAARYLGRTNGNLEGVKQAAMLVMERAARTSQAQLANRTASGAGRTSGPGAPGAGQNQVLRLHRAKSGQTAQSLSLLYFGSPDFAVSILRANRLPWHTVSLDPGSLLVIPASPQLPG